MAERECITHEPDWEGLRRWLWEQDAMQDLRDQHSSVLCVGCRQWFVWMPGGLKPDPLTGQPAYRCYGCEMARAAGFESWDQFRLAVNRVAMRRSEALRGELR